MNRREFKDEVIKILMSKTFDRFDSDMHLFETFNLKNYRVQEVEGDGNSWYEVASMPLNELLDDIYEVIYESSN